MNRRQQIQLTPEEQAAFLQEPNKAALATIDKSGFPHVVAMGFLAKDGLIYMTSYAKAQKVLNIRRNPKVAVMVESGKTYGDYRGIMIRGTCEIIEDPVVVEQTMRELTRSNQGGSSGAPKTAINSAPKRALLKITPVKTASWDHTKLGGKY
ncbi:MAG TPA: pyridoxamine 5'-phosphate oxidase family protein [Candidatus Binataceae bacterium]|nr:pyridoxamine 5'-phosphate oxidase family protein [Candidatus Binataceae bacterium]